jgi:adenylate cyclase
MSTGRRGRVERRLAAILAADVAGYSRLMGVDEEGTLRRLNAHRGQLLDPKISEHHGRIVKTTGDGLLAEFPSVVDAVRCAAETQRAMTDRNAEVAEDRRIAFRIGINLGDVIVEGDDIFGDGVNIAARLEALAEPGGICISGTVHDHIGDRLPYAFDDMGEQRVKNIARPVRAYAMSPTAIAATPLVPAQALRRRPSPSRRVGRNERTRPRSAETKSAPRLSIVVLPFANLSSDPEQEYFVDAVVDDLTTDLSRIVNSFVIARTTAFTYKGKPVDVKQIGRELGVCYVLEGSVRRLGEQVQVNVQLIDAESGGHIWADRLDTDRTNLARAQSEITTRLARTLQLELLEAVGRRIERDKPVNLNASDLVMRGWALFYGRCRQQTCKRRSRLSSGRLRSIRSRSMRGSASQRS